MPENLEKNILINTIGASPSTNVFKVNQTNKFKLYNKHMNTKAIGALFKLITNSRIVCTHNVTISYTRVFSSH